VSILLFLCTNSDPSCTNVSCTNGKCSSTFIDCDDGKLCTDDTCVPSVGCVSTPQNNKCISLDPCETTSCEPNDALADATGCRRLSVACNATTEYCTNVSCIAFDGCSTFPKVCENNNTDNSSCIQVKCSNLKRSCVKEELDCFSFGVVAGAIIGAGAAVGIAVGALLLLGLVGGGAYGISNLVNIESNPPVSENPLYNPKTKTSEGLFQD